MNTNEPVRSSPVPMGQQIARILRERLVTGVYESGQRLPDEDSLAAEFGVSRGTLRRGVADLVRQGLVVRKRGKGTFVISSGRHAQDDVPTIGVLVWDEHYLFPDVIRGVSKEAQARGYSVNVACSAPERLWKDGEDEDHALQALLKAQPAGLVVVPYPASASDYGAHRRWGVPVVLALESCHLDEDYVVADNFSGARQAIEHLYSLGHRSIAHITHGDVHDVPARSERLRGFRETSARLGILEGNRPEIEVAINNSKTLRKQVAETIRDNESVTAFFCYNDYIAHTLFTAARLAGKSVPEDFSVVGFDDSPYACDCQVPLTSVSQKLVQIGVVATRMVIEKIERPEETCKRAVLVAPRLVVRESTAPPRGAVSHLIEVGARHGSGT